MWKNDLREGKGKFYYNDGGIYYSEFKNGLREGKRILYYNNGDRYDAVWKNNLKEGSGIFFLLIEITKLDTIWTEIKLVIILQWKLLVKLF